MEMLLCSSVINFIMSSKFARKLRFKLKDLYMLEMLIVHLRRRG